MNWEPSPIITPIQQAISLARRHLDDDPHLANYILRDRQEVKDAGLDELSWSMHGQTISKNDVLFLIERLEMYLDQRKGGL